MVFNQEDGSLQRIFCQNVFDDLKRRAFAKIFLTKGPVNVDPGGNVCNGGCRHDLYGPGTSMMRTIGNIYSAANAAFRKADRKSWTPGLSGS